MGRRKIKNQVQRLESLKKASAQISTEKPIWASRISIVVLLLCVVVNFVLPVKHIFSHSSKTTPTLPTDDFGGSFFIKFFNFYNVEVRIFSVENSEENLVGLIPKKDKPSYKLFFISPDKEEPGQQYYVSKPGTYYRFRGPAGKLLHEVNVTEDLHIINIVSASRIERMKAHNEEYLARTGHSYLPYRKRPEVAVHMLSTESGVGSSSVVKIPKEHGICNDGKCLQNHMGNEVEMHVLSQSPAVFKWKNIVSDFEVRHLLQLAQNRYKVSTMGQPGYEHFDPGRNSSTTFIGASKDKLVHRICRRLLFLMGLSPKTLQHTEAMQIVRYGPGGVFFPHVDTVNYDMPRLATVGLYLSTVAKGGSTIFPKAFGGKGLVVKAEAKSAIMWYTLLPDGNIDHNSLHAGAPVLEGEKYFANLWIHDTH